MALFIIVIIILLICAVSWKSTIPFQCGDSFRKPTKNHLWPWELVSWHCCLIQTSIFVKVCKLKGVTLLHLMLWGKYMFTELLTSSWSPKWILATALVIFLVTNVSPETQIYSRLTSQCYRNVGQWLRHLPNPQIYCRPGFKSQI